MLFFNQNLLLCVVLLVTIFATVSANIGDDFLIGGNDQNIGDTVDGSRYKRSPNPQIDYWDIWG
ncbi:FIP (Fungus-Induced Protein) Related [Caenorhabditis elegans]|uniref:FIP (Fungus-Induced Protein) Related n=1 Tax=Caenorhabditis elegans TaxID=6239 RepID=Q565A5_CAEEL|nr:FIP (Fungus-Induced Protein) Related [Caenorhabditis elegans]CAI79222.1 FIP (Fungus-Induced Protein) Related [Caenorhabditis elegans]|eukprot:NP_001023934.1 Uncharacterized protein CELE_F46B6.13 [Caenorhabditis elegans]